MDARPIRYAELIIQRNGEKRNRRRIQRWLLSFELKHVPQFRKVSQSP